MPETESPRLCGGMFSATAGWAKNRPVLPGMNQSSARRARPPGQSPKLRIRVLGFTAGYPDESRLTAAWGREKANRFCTGLSGCRLVCCVPGRAGRRYRHQASQCRTVGTRRMLKSGKERQNAKKQEKTLTKFACNGILKMIVTVKKERYA